MSHYICVTHAAENRNETEQFCRGLARYGFRYSCMNEQTESARRGELLADSALLIALTSPEAACAETVAADIRRALERGKDVLCVSLGANELDDRFCGGGRSGVALIPYPVGETPDRHSVALFVHRLFVRHLSRLEECFSALRCVEDTYGRTVAYAVRAHGGDGDACYALGGAYERGEGVPVLENEAALWIARAAEAGVTDARIHMGELHLAGRGTDRDAEKAFRLFTLAAEDGDARGDYHRGLCYLYGHGVMKDPERAIHYLRMAARTDHAPAMYRLGLLYRDGIGTAPNRRAALHFLYAAYRQGVALLSESREGELSQVGSNPTDGGDVGVPSVGQSTEGMMAPLSLYGRCTGRHFRCISMRQMRRVRLSVLLEARFQEAGGLSNDRRAALMMRSFSKNTVTAVHLPEDGWPDGLLCRTCGAEAPAVERMDPSAPLHRSAQPNGTTLGQTDLSEFRVADAALALGQLLERGEHEEGEPADPTRALAWYRCALRLGSTESLYRLGDAYRRGYGVPADAERAVKLFRIAAAWGDERGQFALAVCCERGIGTEPDMAEAVRCYEQAANAGFAPAQNNLGGCYEYGLGVVQNWVTAVEWYARAAQAAQPDAACRLGLCYENGRGVPVDMAKAFRLYEFAAKQGHAYALYRLGLCYDRGVNADSHPSAASVATEHGAAADLSVRDTADRRHDSARADAGEHAPASADGWKLTPHYAYAAYLWERAAQGGVADAAYALSLYYRHGRGVQRDEAQSLAYLRMAADGGNIQACYQLGICYLEGWATVQNHHRAVDCFARAAELWRARSESVGRSIRANGADMLPLDALSLNEAAGGALYMLGYCTLYAIGGEPAAPTAPSSSEHCRVEKAVRLFREAAETDHVGAITALGDLYAYGLLEPETATAADESLHYYMEAARIGTARTVLTDDPTDSPINALMSLAERSVKVAETDVVEQDLGSAELAWVQAWRSFAGCAEQGSADALVGMAECAFHGHGTPENRAAAVWFLERAEHMSGGRVAASLWLGDLLRSGWCGDPRLTEADDAYLRALHTPYVESECGCYTVAMRRAERKNYDRRARAEALYRLATLRAVHFSDDPLRRESFPYLAEAVLMGHSAARDDLARMYAYETGYIDATTPTQKGKDSRELPHVAGMRARHRLKKHTPVSGTRRDSRAGRSHHGWMTDYYTALWPEPLPFTYTMRSAAVPTDIPAYVTVPVTDVMRASALNYLGDCLFYGQGLPEDAASAVACYREVVGMRLNLGRGEPVPPGVTWAQYSLGWCLLRGVGTPQNAREAVLWLTRASRTHAEACYCLGECYERGEGVDVADDREAIKYYRKALKLGYRKAEVKVEELEKRLRNPE